MTTAREQALDREKLTKALEVAAKYATDSGGHETASSFRAVLNLINRGEYDVHSPPSGKEGAKRDLEGLAIGEISLTEYGIKGCATIYATDLFEEFQAALRGAPDYKAMWEALENILKLEWDKRPDGFNRKPLDEDDVLILMKNFKTKPPQSSTPQVCPKCEETPCINGDNCFDQAPQVERDTPWL